MFGGANSFAQISFNDGLHYYQEDQKVKFQHLVFFVILLGCNSQSYVPKYILEKEGIGQIKLGQEYSELEKLGFEISESENGITYSWLEDGEVLFYTLQSNEIINNRWVDHISTTSSRVSTKEGIRIGVTFDQFVDIFPAYENNPVFLRSVDPNRNILRVTEYEMRDIFNISSLFLVFTENETSGELEISEMYLQYLY